MAWDAGSIVEVVDYNMWRNMVNTDAAQTISALKTFSAGITLSGTTAGLTLPTMTTAQRDTWGATNGRGVYNSTTGQMNWVEGGAWGAPGSTTVADGSTTVAGKYEEATVAEQGTATATGGTGARLIPANANIIKTSAGAADENKLIVMNSAGVVDVSGGGTGVRNPTLGSLYVGAGSSAMTAVAPSTSANVCQSNGSTWVSNSVPARYWSVLCSGTSSAAITNPTTPTAGTYDTHTYAIPANTLISGVGFEFEAVASVTWVAGDFHFCVMFGTTTMMDILVTPTASSNTVIKGTVYGTAAAGASVAVRVGGLLVYNSGGSGRIGSNYTSTSVATNGSLTMQFAGYFGTSDVGHATTLLASRIGRLSTTTFNP